jgi:hypothetical protein
MSAFAPLSGGLRNEPDVQVVPHDEFVVLDAGRIGRESVRVVCPHRTLARALERELDKSYFERLCRPVDCPVSIEGSTL